MAIIIQKEDAKFTLQLLNFSQKIGTYAATLGLTPAEVTAMQADTEYFNYCFVNLGPIKSFAQTITNYKDIIRYGRGSEVAGAYPTLPVLDTPPTAVAANVESRFRKLVQRIVNSPNYTKAIGEDLGIEGPEVPFNPQLGKPEFFIELSSGGHPNLRWQKGKFQGIEIFKNTGSGWNRLDKDYSPDYIDKTALPPVGQSATWSYKMIYLFKDEVVGSYSDEVSVVVTGQI